MTTGLALTRPEPMMDRQSLGLMLEQAERYVASGLLPTSIKTPQQALIIMAAGRELGIPATVALRGIVVVQGKPTCSAELMMALVHRTYGQGAMRVARTDNESCTVQYRQQGWDGVSEYTFSMEDARRANLLKNPTWNQYPAAMLRARAISATVRFAFPEVISGVYLPEELGAEVEIVDGTVVPVHPDKTPTPRTVVESAWTDSLRQRWTAGIKAANEIGADLPDEPPSTASREEIVAALRELGENVRKAARTRLEDELHDVIAIANDQHGGDYEIPDDLALRSDDEVRELIASVQDTIARATAA